MKDRRQRLSTQTKVVRYNGVQPFPIMHTEDDTFNALRRIPYREMRRIAFRIRMSWMLGLPTEDLEEEFKKHGWTRAEYEAYTIPAEEHAVKVVDFEGIIIKPVNPYKVSHNVQYP